MEDLCGLSFFFFQNILDERQKEIEKNNTNETVEKACNSVYIDAF